MIAHELKTWPQYFARIFSGQKTFELRKDDRHFDVGDTLHLKEFDPLNNEFTGREILKTVKYVLRGTEETEKFGLKNGYCIMSLS